MSHQSHSKPGSRPSRPVRRPFKHKCWCTMRVLALTTSLLLLSTCCQTQAGDPSAGAQTSRARPVSSNKRHLSTPYNSAEYFYANDKLADEQVAHFVNSLNGSSSSSAQTPVSAYQRPSSGTSVVVGGSRASQYAVSSAFPASLLSRTNLPVHSTSSSSHSSSYSSHSQPTHSLPGYPSTAELPYSSSSSFSKSSQTEGANSPASGLHHSSSSRQAKPSSSSRISSGFSRNHSTAIRSHPVPEFDLSWVQPVYVPVKNAVLNDSSKVSFSSSDAKLQLNAFKSEPIDLFPNPPSSNKGSFNHSGTVTSTESSIIDSGSLGDLEHRLESFSAALANVTFSLREEQWVAPIIALSLLNILVIFTFECFVLYRACRTCPSRRHLFLGQMLLLGLFLSSVMGLAFAPNSNWLTCTLIRAGVGVCFAIVYGTLLVKTVFLLSLHTGVYLSAEYQALLLFFIISTQVAIDVQWLLHKSSSIVIDYMDGYGHAVYKCDHSINQLLISLIYIIILIVLMAIMAFRVRGYRENHGEALFLGITSTCTVVLWFVWIAGSLTSTPHYRDGFVAFGLVANATLLFIVMFLPKGRQLAAVGREGHLDDRDQLSTASSPSIYTPSFLHIKPVSQLMPMGKPSIAGLSSVVSGGVSGGLNGGPGGGGYHLYKQFQGTGTTLTSPMSTTGPPGPLTSAAHAMPNSYSSHAIFASSNKQSTGEQKHLSVHDEEHNDPNYSNLSNVFAASNMPHTAGNLHSPMSENISSSNSSGSGSGSGGSSQKSKSTASGRGGSKSSQASKASGKLANVQQMVKSPSGTANADCFFYLQPPPLPPPSGRPPQPPGPGGQSTGQMGAQARIPWRQTCYTPNYHRTGGGGVGLHHYPKSLAGLSSSHYSSHQADHVRTPMGGPTTPSGLGTSLHHHLLSPSSDNETTSFYFASFDAAGSTTRQLLADRSNGGGQNGHSRDTAGGHNASTFKYFRGPHY